ncbi:MAG: SpoIVB peptidase S55 domain-containing protein [Acidobacteriota bacterium]
MPVDEIHPGMEGVGRTVFEGDTIEEFRVEILGILKNAIGPQEDMILARLHGDRIEYTGVVAGMSGSPVYIDGRLVGAVAYRIGSFAKEPIAGITPIASMLRLADAPARGVSEQPRPPDLLGRFLGTANGGVLIPTAGESPTPLPALQSTASAGGQMEPIGTPLICTGCDAGVLRYYAPIFEAHGLQPMTGGGVSEEASLLPLEPGSPIAAALALGDLAMTGVGTLTAMDEDRILAFGHPVLGTGPIEVPMTQAEVLLTFASEAGSFKVANATRPIGSFVRDGLTGVVGRIGRSAPTIPVDVHVSSPAGERSFHYRVLDNRSWSPVLIAVTTANSLVRTTEYDAGAALGLKYRISLEGYPDVLVEEIFSGTSPTQPVHLALANAAGGLFGVLHNNRFETPRMLGARVDVEVLPENRVAVIKSLSVSRTRVRPGQTIRVMAVLKPYRGESRTVVWDVKIPEDMPRGDARIVVGSGPAINSLERQVLQRRISQAGSLTDLIALLESRRRNSALYLSLSRRSPSAVVRTDVLSDLPLSIFSVFNSPRLSSDATLMFRAPVLELERDLDLVVVGGRRISVKVQ